MKKELFYIAIMLFGLLLGACSTDEPTNEPNDEPIDDPVEATELTLALSTADIEVGETLEIEYTILPEDADNKTITWSTSNAEVATVSAEGVVSGLARGSATITAELGTLKASCEVNVWSVADQVIESEFLDIRYWGDYYNTGYDNFTVSFGTVEFADMNISSTGDFFQLSANTTKFTNIAAAYLYPGVYTFDEESPYEEMTITGRQQSMRIRYSDDTNNDGAMEEQYNYMLDAYMDIEYDEVEEVCIFVAEVKLDTEEVIRIHYRGSVYFTNLLEHLIPDQITEDLDFVCEYATSSHMGDGVYLIDMQETEDGWIDTQMITMTLNTEPNDDSIKAGVYPISAEPVDGGYMSNGYYVTSSGSTYYQGSYAYILRSDYSMSYAFIDEGTLTISYEGDNITVELEAKDLGGYRVHTKYSGPQILQKQQY